ncbi:MAG: phosphate regulon sensor histidine kinase PhoR [Rudaea sp.]
MSNARARRLAAQLRNLLDAAASLPDALVLLDKADRVRWFNRAAQRLLGLRWPQDRGVVLSERLGETELGAWLRASSRESAADLIAPADDELNLSAMLIAFGERQRLLLARDITHVSRLEQVRRDFVANVSHELRTPLTVIHGYLELLNEDDVPALAPVLAEMRAQSRRMGQIVEDLLTLSRLEMQQRLPEEEQVALTPMLASLRKEAQALSQGRHRICVEDTAGVDLLGWPRELHSAFSNLVSNAVRYTPTGGEIDIRWRLIPEGAEYSVTDTGYGIPANHIARLAERFYRVSSSRSRETGGTGLGLSIVKHVLNLHQARLTISSVPGKGSTFACVFDGSRVVARGAISNHAN